MANNVSALNKERYSLRVQNLLRNTLIAFDIANVALKDRMPDGNTVNFPRASYLGISDYVKGTDISLADIDTSNETLVINKTPIISFSYDDVDSLDNGYDIVSETSSDSAYRIKNDIEGNLLAEYVNALSSNAATTALTTGTTANVFGAARAELMNDGVSNIVAVVDHNIMNSIGQAAIINTFNVSDKSYTNAYQGDFQGMQLFASNNLSVTGTLAMATIPTAADTVTVNGVVFTFIPVPMGGVEGDVVIGANVGEARANLTAAVNKAAGDGVTYFAFTDNVTNGKLEGQTFTVNGAAIDYVSKRGYRKVSSSLTPAADKFGQLTIHSIIMARGSIHLVMQKGVNMKTSDIPLQLGTIYKVWARYGIKTFTQGAERMFDLPLEAQAAE